MALFEIGIRAPNGDYYSQLGMGDWGAAPIVAMGIDAVTGLGFLRMQMSSVPGFPQLYWQIEGNFTFVNQYNSNGVLVSYVNTGSTVTSVSVIDSSFNIYAQLSQFTYTITSPKTTVSNENINVFATSFRAIGEAPASTAFFAIGDTLIGSSGGEILQGYGGPDIITGGGAADTLYGGTGNDTFVYAAGDAVFGEQVFGGDGIDEILGMQEVVDISSLVINNVEVLHTVNYVIATSAQFLPGGFQTLRGTQGTGGSGQAAGVIIQNAGNYDFSSLLFQDWDDVRNLVSLEGSNASEVIIGTSRIDHIHGLGGNDTLRGGLGNDNLSGNEGNDILEGGSGSNYLWGNGGSDRAVYSVASGTVTRTNNGNGSWPLTGAGFSDTLIGVETVQFTDRTISLRQRARSDLTGDGTSDVLWINPTNQTVGSWVMFDGRPTWQVIGQGSTTVRAVGIGDFNADGTSDVLWVNPTNGLVGEWLMVAGRPVWQQIGQGSTTMSVAGVGDFNGDGASDILWRNPTNNYVGIWQMQNNTPNWIGLGFGSTTVQYAGIGDFNGDGRDDILWINPTNNFVGIWSINGSTPVWNVMGVGSTTMTHIGVGDFNGDGTSDVLWENLNNGTVGYWGVQNGVQATWNVMGTASTAYSVAGIGDYDDNGVSDILWRNAATGGTGTWLNINGTATWRDLGVASLTVNPLLG